MKKTETVKAEAMKVASKVKAETAKTADKVKVEAAKVAKTADTTAETVKAATAKATKAADSTATTVKAAAKKVARKAPAKKTAPKTDVYIQFADREYTEDSVVKMVKEVWTKKMKKKIGDMKTLAIYIKPEEFAAYYVINGDVVGRVEL